MPLNPSGMRWKKIAPHNIEPVRGSELYSSQLKIFGKGGGGR